MTHPSRWLVRSLLGTALALSGASCSGGQLDRHFRSGRHDEVVRAFEADSLRQRRERALLQAGLSYVGVEPPLFNPARSRTLLEQLVRTFPSSEYRSVADPVLVLLGELDRRTQQAAAAASDADSLRARVAQTQREAASQRARAEQLQGAVRERDQRIQALERQLAALKRIDLNH